VFPLLAGADNVTACIVCPTGIKKVAKEIKFYFQAHHSSSIGTILQDIDNTTGLATVIIGNYECV